MPVLSLTSQEIDEHGFVVSEKFVTNGGLEMEIRPTPSGLYEIRSLGGSNHPPKITAELFTSPGRAKQELIRYLDATDRNGFAVHSEKPPEEIRKRKTRGER